MGYLSDANSITGAQGDVTGRLKSSSHPKMPFEESQPSQINRLNSQLQLLLRRLGSLFGPIHELILGTMGP